MACAAETGGFGAFSLDRNGQHRLDQNQPAQASLDYRICNWPKDLANHSLLLSV
jgi:hypothetical protein